jgi:NAD(P)-dependent dehydrogenase (short-subunit alcohol dehydrogenase family)
MQRLAGRVAVVTGAADGIGRALAIAMAVEGVASCSNRRSVLG